MDWFKPTIYSIPTISTICVQCVFLTYLLKLRSKTGDCYLMIATYLSLAAYLVTAFFFNSDTRQTADNLLVYHLLRIIGYLAVIWCSYRIYKNSFPRESVVVTIIFAVLFGLSTFLSYKDFQQHGILSFERRLFNLTLCSAATFLASVNYFRKFRASFNGNSFYVAFKRMFYPQNKVESFLGGSAISLFMFALLWWLDILNEVGIQGDVSNLILNYLLGVSLITLNAIVYLDYTPQQTSFETKLVGITLYIILTILAFIPMLVFGASGTAPLKFLLPFVVIIPVTTILIAVFLPLLFRVTVLKHLNKIVSGVQTVITGDLTATIDVEVNDEIGRLSNNFNKMTGSLRQRTEQLSNMRETIASDFHDQTGNMLSAITRQASLLKFKLGQDHGMQPMVESIINNSNDLYNGSKDFLWHLNHDSEAPSELFNYLTAYGQLYYNQFDIAFFSVTEDCNILQFEPSVALNLIFIIKEAMTNVVKHSGATEVKLSLTCGTDDVTYKLEDNGRWKDADKLSDHYGVNNMKRRCMKNKFGFELITNNTGTCISVKVPAQMPNAY